jgi:hypothetical protein
MIGQQHLIQCHCVLPQYRGRKDPVYHKFAVFSIIDESDTVVPKFVQCNNCGVIHKVFDICKSEIITGKDEMRNTAKIDDFKFGIPNDLINLLTTYNCDLNIWEHVYFSLVNENWGSKIVLTRETINDETTGKILTIKSNKQFVVEDYILNENLIVP